MHKTVEQFERRAESGAAMRELVAQYEALRRFNIWPSHADNHMGSLYGTATGRSHIPQVLKQCAKWKLPFRLFRKVHPADPVLSSIPGVEKAAIKASALAGVLGVAIPDYLLSHPFHVQEGETYDSFKQSMIAKMYDIPEGISETYIHPAVDHSRMLAEVPDWEKRVWEYKLMLDADFSYAIQDAGVVLTDYEYIRKYGKASRVGSAFTLARELLRK
jgi:predicted glycoside hydrolase/deacetylase ChbG (UPF0249 family)